MLTYTQASARAFAKGTIPDGYFGEIAHALFALADDGSILAVTKTGHFRFPGLSPATDETEAVWLLKHHPESRASNVQRLS